MKRRIIKETYKDNTVKYRIEIYTWFNGWHTETKRTYWAEAVSTREPLIFNTLEEAKKCCGIPINPIISKEIIEI